MKIYYVLNVTLGNVIFQVHHTIVLRLRRLRRRIGSVNPYHRLRWIFHSFPQCIPRYRAPETVQSRITYDSIRNNTVFSCTENVIFGPLIRKRVFRQSIRSRLDLPSKTVWRAVRVIIFIF